MLRRLKRHLDILVIVLLVMSQGVQAMHVHLQPQLHGARAFAVSTQPASDASCPVCWANQVTAAASPSLEAHVVALFRPCAPLCQPMVAQAAHALSRSPRGPPAA